MGGILGNAFACSRMRPGSVSEPISINNYKQSQLSQQKLLVVPAPVEEVASYQGSSSLPSASTVSKQSSKQSDTLFERQ